MKEAQLLQICVLLDKESVIFNWRNLVDKVFQEDKKRSDLKKDLEIYENGGVNLGFIFLESLKTRIRTVQEFKIHTVKHIPLHDYLSNQFTNENKLFEELGIVELENIARFLNNNTPGVFNWEDYAGKFKYSDTEIMDIRNSKNSNNSSPSKRLLMNELPQDFTLYKLYQSFGNQKEKNLLQVKIDEITELIMENDFETK